MKEAFRKFNYTFAPIIVIGGVILFAALTALAISEPPLQPNCPGCSLRDSLLKKQCRQFNTKIDSTHKNCIRIK